MLAQKSSFILNPENKTSNNKEYFHVKLTASALTSIQAALSNKNAEQTITFDDKSGSISLGTTQFSFSVADPLKDGSRHQDIIHLNPSNGKNGSISILGPMTKRLTVHAKDDVYQSTREKIAQVETEAKRVSTKELEPARGSALRRAMPPPGQLPPTKRKSKIHGIRNAPPPAVPASQAVSKSASASVLERLSKPTKLEGFPLRERLLHILAAHSYRKPEIVIRLGREMSDEDKLQVNSLLTELGKLDRSVYSLKEQYFSEVDMEWPGYSPSDRDQVKRRMEAAQHLQLSGTKRSASAALDPPSPPKRSSPMKPVSRSPVSPAGTFLSPSCTPSPSEPEPLTDLPLMAMSQPSTEEASPLSELSACSPLSESDLDRTRLITDQQEAKNVTELEAHYPPLETSTDRKRYKLDFATAYPEYQTLWQKVAKHAKQIDSWDRALSSERPGSQQHQRLQQEVFDFYLKLKGSNGDLLRDLQRANYLHRKLKIIKERLRAFRGSPQQPAPPGRRSYAGWPVAAR